MFTLIVNTADQRLHLKDWPSLL